MILCHMCVYIYANNSNIHAFTCMKVSMLQHSYLAFLMIICDLYEHITGYKQVGRYQ